MECIKWSLGDIVEIKIKQVKKNYRSGEKYLEALFGRDFQFYPETVDSYKKIYDEGLKVLGSFRKIDEDYEFVVNQSVDI